MNFWLGFAAGFVTAALIFVAVVAYLGHLFKSG